eukprot:Gregarina_sp_Poly_1__353@NODE_1086_length_5140_cov_448_935344_g288_i1_p2_GENE_NODE_1086_length_5140_cov_448_935344_g288_i1NODE_1086_length_5140_cov_448_935344_g288_i1_p2_ORF_typecomplete_len325_score19_79Pkinase/PF00069_25/4_6e13Pkinase_Tyr/PF07714_17/1_4e09Kinaselike/PF14531_6/0_00038_NODE_1086_length_5140_cov_448_935344_g288_i123353309
MRYFVGTPHFMPPEFREGKGKSVGPASDVWSFGCLLYQLATGRPAAIYVCFCTSVLGAPPFAAPSDYLVFVRSHFVDLDIPIYLSPWQRELILRCLQTTSQDRPSKDSRHMRMQCCLGVENLLTSIAVDKSAPEFQCSCLQSRRPETHSIVTAFRSRWSYLQSLMLKYVESQSRDTEHWTPQWLLQLYKDAETPSILSAGQTLQRSKSLVDSLLLKPHNPVWVDVFQAVRRAYIEMPASQQAASHRSVLAELVTGPFDLGLDAPSEMVVALDCYVRLVFDVLRGLDTQSRTDGYWDDLSNRWMSISTADRPTPLREGDEVVDLK